MAQRDLLCCDLAGVHVAVPLERVIGVAEGVLVTPLPYSAPSFEGLVEVFGQVMPQVSLASMLGRRAGAGGILVVVSDRGGSLALRVEHVTGMIQVDGERLVPTAARARSLHPLYIAEVEHQGAAHYVIDLDLLATSDELELSAPAGAVLLPEARTSRGEPEPEQEWLPLLLLDIAGERYAVPNGSIVELNVPDGMRTMPSAPPWILGLIDVRGTPMIAVSTAALLGRPLPEGPPPEVCLIAELDDGVPVALFVDRAIGLERISPAVIHPMQQPMVGIGGYFVMHDDEIVGLIDPRLLLSQVGDELRAAVPRQPAAAEAAARAGDLGQNQQLLSLRVGRELYAMTLDRIERIEASVRLTPLPSHIAYFDGLADVGDAIVPVIDLRRQQGAALAPFDMSERPPCILTLLEGAMTGILVDQVLSIVDIPSDRFEPVRDAARLPISHVVTYEHQLIALLTIDRLLPRPDQAPAPGLPAPQPEQGGA
jgi:chemotaxis signal transduction protein